MWTPSPSVCVVIILFIDHSGTHLLPHATFHHVIMCHFTLSSPTICFYLHVFVFALITASTTSLFTISPTIKRSPPSLLQMLDAFSSMGHYSRELYDDIGDSITYANNYLAPVRAPTHEVCDATMRVLLSEYASALVSVHASTPTACTTLVLGVGMVQHTQACVHPPWMQTQKDCAPPMT